MIKLQCLHSPKARSVLFYLPKRYYLLTRVVETKMKSEELEYVCASVWVCIIKVCSYIARYPVHRTAQSALHFTPWQTCSFQSHINFFGKYSATLQLLREGYSFTYPPLSVLPGTHLYS